LTIEPDGEGCIATIVHELAAKWADFKEQTAYGWSASWKATDNCLEN